MCPCRCKGSVAWHNTCNSNSTGLDIPCCQSCQCRCKGSPVASLNKGLDIPCCQSCQCRCKGSPVASLNKGLDIPCCQSCQCRCKGSPVASLNKGLDIPCCQSCQCRCKGSPVALFTHRLGLFMYFSTFFRLTSDFDNFGFFQAPGSNPQGSNPTNERVDIYLVNGIFNVLTGYFLGDLHNHGWKHDDIDHFADGFVWPSRLRGAAAKDILQKRKPSEALKCGASEALNFMQLLRVYVLLFVLPNCSRDVRDSCEVWLALCKVIDALQAITAKASAHSPLQLQHLIKRHLDLAKSRYGDSWWVPKCHLAGHLALLTPEASGAPQLLCAGTKAQNHQTYHE